MKFITVRDFRTSPAKIWKELPQEQEMIITNNGKPIALLTPVNDTDFEEALSAVRKARAINGIKEMQISSFNSKISGMTMDEIDHEIREARKQRKG